MPVSRSPRRARLAAILSAALALTGLQLLISAPAAQANPGGTGLVISEVYGGGGNGGASRTHDFIELYNPTAAPISVAGWSVQYRSAAGTTPALTNLTGSVPAGGHYLIQEASQAAVGTGMPTPNASGAIAMSGTAGVVILANDTTGVTAVGNFAAGSVPAPPANVIDTVGFGTTPTTFEGTNTNVALSATTSAQRAANGADTDANNPDFSEAVPTPTNAAGETEPPVASTPTIADIANRNGVVGTAISNINASATGGVQPYTWSAGGTLPTGVSIDPATGVISGTPTAAGPFNVVITVTDATSPTPVQDTEDFTFTISAAPVGPTPIKDIQGTGTVSPIDGQTVIAEGEVTARYPAGGLNGFYIQTPGADTANASDAIFVYGGTGGFTTYPALGASVSVTGTVGEFSGQTQITTNDAGVTSIADLPGSVTPKTQIPGADCALPGTGCASLADLNTAREVAEGESFQPTGDYTATDVYDFSPFIAFDGGSSNGSSMFGEIGLAANSDMPLVAPTEVIDAQATADKNARIAYNNAHRIVLDDGSSTNYTTAANTGLPFPWLTATHQVRVGAAVTFPSPVIFTFGFNTWRLLPSTQVVGAPTGTQPQFAQTRAANAAPQDVGGDVKLATFNVLNFFPTTGNEFVALGGGRTCSYFLDRAGNQITNDSCNPNGPRGAANAANLARQRAKIVSAINTSGADIVSLEELENSVHFGKARDFAINELVTALNAAAGTGTWAAVPSPAAADLPVLAEQDVIRNGFIYKPTKVALVGGSVVLADQSTGTEAFADAREPLAQAFKRIGTPNADAFAVIVNHFKSKGSGNPDPDGQGNANERRVLQANALVTFADSFATLRGISRVFLAGDFNAYSEEDPIQILNAAGYTNLESTSNPEEESYNFDGQIGSLDHVLANDEALADVEDVDIWEINSNESVYYEYSRYNYNVTDLYLPGPFKSSDHNPELVGINTADPTTTDIQILGTNDFHGRIANDPLSASAGAGVLAGAVKQLRGNNPNTVFSAAGDLIGASTFESFILNDKPTIDALNEAGLDVSSVGNHEFDQGYDDLVNRVMAAYDPEDNPEGGAEWAYLGANVRFKANNNPALPSTWTKDFGSVRVGFVGTVTEHLPELVSPGGIEDITVTDIVTETNNAANDLVNTQNADIVIMLVHEGAPNTNCTTMDDDPTSDFGSIITGVNDNVDAIISGHTHLEYDCSFVVPGWANRPVTERPVVSAGQYGTALNRLVFTVDDATGNVVAKSQSVLRLKSCANATTCTNYPNDASTQAIVDAALAEAAVLGAVPLGQIAGPMKRGYLLNGTTENRGVESVLGNLVAEAQRWQTSGAEAGGAQIAFMNPGGLRTDMLGVDTAEIPGPDPYPRTVSYKQAAEVQPFANGLVNMDLTGAQIKAALEQQWQPAGASRPFLKLGASAGFTYTSDPDAAQGSRITGMWLDGVPIVPATVYSVTVNSFLSTGGDNFGAFVGGLNKAEAGLSDLQAMVNYLDEFANTGEGDSPLPVPSEQNGVHVNFPAGAPASYAPDAHVLFDVSGWSFSNTTDPLDTAVVVELGGATLGTFPLNNAIQAALPGFDATGTASVDVVIPAGTPSGANNLVLTGATTGTEIVVPVNVTGVATITADDVTITYGQPAVIEVEVSGNGTPTGTVELFDGTTSLGSAPLVAGVATITLAPRSVPPSTRTLTAVYSGGGNFLGGEVELELTVDKAPATANAENASVAVGADATIPVTVTGTAGITPAGTVQILNGSTVLGTANLSGGTANVVVDSSGLALGDYTLTARYLGSQFYLADDDTLVLTVGKATPALAISAPVKTYGKPSNVTVTVAASGVSPTGTVQIRRGATVLGTGTVNATGRAVITLPGTVLTPGSYPLTAVYSGDANVAARTAGFTQTVVKAAPSISVEIKPDTIRVDRTKGKIVVKVKADGVNPVTGKVKITVQGQGTTQITLDDGRAVLNLAVFKQTGKRSVTVEYVGSALVNGATVKDSLTVKP